MKNNFFAHSVASLKEPYSFKIYSMAAGFQASGRDIINLAVGQSDFDMMATLKQAGVEAFDRNDTRYSPVGGSAAFKAAVAEKFRRENGLTYDLREIMGTTGAIQGLSNALRASLNPGDEVILVEPYWDIYYNLVRISGGKPVVAATHAKTGFKLQPEQLDAVITPRTKWLLLNSPNNPTGAVYSRELLHELVQVLKKHGHVWVLSDEIYEHRIHTGLPHISIAKVDNEAIKHRTLIVHGVSKSDNMTGLRVGFAAGPRKLIQMMERVQLLTTLGPSSISQAAAIEALSRRSNQINHENQIFAERFDRIVENLNSISGISCAAPEGGMYVFPDLSCHVGRNKRFRNDEQFALALLQNTGVALAPGRGFHKNGYGRLCIGAEMRQLDEACNRIEEFCRLQNG